MAAVIAVWLMAAPGASAEPAGSLRQLSGTAGCLSQTGSGGLCADGRAIDGVQSVAVSSDGRHVYSAAVQSNSVAAFSRGDAGEIEQLAGTDACVATTAAEGCVVGRALSVPDWITLSADGNNAYVTSAASDATAIFSRDPDTGALTQLPGAAGCVSSAASELTCTLGRALDGAAAVVLSPDGANAYVASFNSDSIAVFARSTGTGELTQLAGLDGCISRTGTSGSCATGSGMDGLAAVAVSPDGKHVYATARLSKAVTVYARDAATGALTRLGGTDGCVAAVASASCVQANGLPGPNTVVVSPDGGHVYVGSFVGSSLAVFSRDSESGALTQLPGAQGCFNGDDSQPACTSAVALDGTFSLTDSPNGANVYVAAYDSDAVSIFSRDAASGALAQLEGTDGCVSLTGTSGACNTVGTLDGAHHVALDSAGTHAYAPANLSDAISVFDVTQPDTTAPETAITSGSEGPTTDASPSFVFDSSEEASSFECKLDGPGAATGSYAACSSPQGYAGLEDGEYTFFVRATDQAGNPDPSPATRAFTLDTQAPAAPDIIEPVDGSIQASSDVNVSGTAEPGSTVEIFDGASSLGSVTADAGGDWAKALIGVSDGPHSYTAVAHDTASNASVASDPSTVTIDTAAPDTTISAGPEGPTADASPSFGFASSEGGPNFECRLDGPGAATGSYAPCTSPRAYADLADGGYTFSVRAVDAAGNVDDSPSSRSFAVDRDQPDTAITVGPSGPTNNASPSFEFDSGDASNFECKLDGPGAQMGSYASCTSPQQYSGLEDGDYTFAVRAVDSAQNEDGSPATRNFTVDTGAPDTTIVSGPEGTTDDGSPSFQLDSTEAGSSFECRLDGPGSATGSYAPCTSPKGYSGLDDGTYTFSARATDAAGNADNSPSTRSFTIDTSVPDPRTSPDPGPPAVDTSAPDGTAGASVPPALSLSLRPGSELATALRRGFLAPVTCQSPCDVSATALAGRGTARRAHLAQRGELVVVGRGAGRLQADDGRVRIRFTRDARRRLRRLRVVRLVLRTTVTDATGETTTSRRVSLRRYSVPRLPRALRGGLRAWGRCSVLCRAEARLVLHGRRARRVGLGRRSLVVASGAASLRANREGTVRLRFSRAARRALARTRRTRLTLWVEVTGPEGRTRTVRRAVVLRR